MSESKKAPAVRSRHDVWHRLDERGCYDAKFVLPEDGEARPLDADDPQVTDGRLCEDCW